MVLFVGKTERKVYVPTRREENEILESVCLLVLSSSKESLFFGVDVFSRSEKSVCEMTHTEKEKATFYYSCEIIRRSLFFFFL